MIVIIISIMMVIMIIIHLTMKSRNTSIAQEIHWDSIVKNLNGYLLTKQLSGRKHVIKLDRSM